MTVVPLAKVAAIMMPIFCFFFLLAGPTVRLFFSDAYSDAAIPFRVMADLTGVPRSAERLVMDWGHAIAPNTDPAREIEPPMGRSGRRAAARQAYSMSAVDEYGPVIDDIYDFAEAQGFEIDGITQEGGAGQLEINLRHGDPVEVLEDIAKKESARLLIVGRTGDTGIRQRMFGGLPSHLVQTAPVPVVVVP